MTVEAWKNEITNALKKDLTAQPDRAGSTPLSRLADKLKEYTPTSRDSDEVLNALLFLIENPVDGFIGKAAKQYWRGLTVLSRSLQTYTREKEKIASAFYAKLFGPRALVSSLRAIALNGAVLAGRRFSPSELNKLDDILETNPMSWLNAAVTGGNFDLAVVKITTLLADDALNINAFILSLDGWRNYWQYRVNFGDVVVVFKNAVRNEKAKDKLQRWMDRRGIRPSDHVGQRKLEPIAQQYNFIPKQLITKLANADCNYYTHIENGQCIA